MKYLAFLFLVLSLNFQTLAQEEEFSFEEENETKVEIPAKSGGGPFGALSKFHLMGRADFSYESTSPFKGGTRVAANDEYKVNHLLLFLKVKASEKVSFSTEFLDKSYYFISYKMSEKAKLHLGKIMVPFGNPRQFHKYYGGLQGYSAQGVMFPNVWAENGFNLETNLGSLTLDLYSVNSAASTAANTDVDLRTASNGSHQAFGTRLFVPTINNLDLVFSAYQGNWFNNKKMYIGGFDLLLGYGLIKVPFLQDLRLSAGIAYADIKKGVLGDFSKRGDYIEMAYRLFERSEIRGRYGNYIHNSKQVTSEDKENYALGFKTKVDVLDVITEYQWNTEAVNEIDNDLLRIMVALNF